LLAGTLIFVGDQLETLYLKRKSGTRSDTGNGLGITWGGRYTVLGGPGYHSPWLCWGSI